MRQHRRRCRVAEASPSRRAADAVLEGALAAEEPKRLHMTSLGWHWQGDPRREHNTNPQSVQLKFFALGVVSGLNDVAPVVPWTWTEAVPVSASMEAGRDTSPGKGPAVCRAP